MLRRDFLKTTFFTPILPRLGGSSAKNFGWLPPLLPSNIPSFLDTYPQFEGVGKGKVVLLYKYIEAVLKKSLSAHKQTGPDCTSHAGGLGVDVLQAIQAVLCKDKWIGKMATEMLHIGGRQIIGGRSSGGVTIAESVNLLM